MSEVAAKFISINEGFVCYLKQEFRQLAD